MNKISTIILLQYNNYYNRIVKKEDSIEDYVTGRNFKVLPCLNFNPNDNIETTHIINTSYKDGTKLEFEPDYCLILDDENNIVSRWFIVKSDRTRGFQYNMFLKRDLIVDYYDPVVQAPCYIEKGFIKDNQDPFLCNSEGLMLNQIKAGERFLVDYTKCAWIVGYCARPNNQGGGGITTEDLAGNTASTLPSGTYEDVTGTEIAQYINPSSPQSVKTNFSNAEFFMLAKKDGANTQHSGFIAERGYSFAYVDGSTDSSLTPAFNYRSSRGYIKATGDIYKYSHAFFLDSDRFSTLWSKIKLDENISDSTTIGELLRSYDGKTVLLNNVLYKLSVSTVRDVRRLSIDTGGDSTKQATIYMNSLLSSWKTYLVNHVDSIYNYLEIYQGATSVSKPKFKSQFEYEEITVTATVSEDNQWKTTLQASHKTLNEECFDMFCIPYPHAVQEGKLYIKDGNNYFDIKGDVGLNVAREIVKKYTNSVIYDVQLLPYCPLQNLPITRYGIIRDRMKLDVSSLKSDTSFINLITNNDGTTIYSFILWCNTNRGSFNIFRSFDVSYPEDDSPLSRKIRNECDIYRLCSPNYAGQFEFSAVKNYSDFMDQEQSGSLRVMAINVDYTYKPYQPYIHLNPVFSGLYGDNYKDARGLICGGDYSISTQNSAWSQYELQNKNYQLIFDRQIENLEVNNSIAMKQAIWGAAGGTVAGGGAGALAGMKLGGPYGAAIGAVVGTAAAGAAGIADINMLQQAQKEQRTYQVDMFDYSLQNIKAMPYTLSKLTALNENNKIFPFLEYYTCSDNEKEALRNKILYNGMTIMRIGKIEDYIDVERHFIKGQIIRIEDLNENSQVANAIYDEIAKGVYI